MKVDITHEEKKVGFISKKTHYISNVQVGFTDEERAIIQTSNIDNHIIAERNIVPNGHDIGDPNVFNLKIRHLLKGKDSYAFFTQQAQAKYQEDVMRSLKGLKAFIEKGGHDTGGVSTEL